MELSKKNHGVVKSSAEGTTFLESYGQDNSDVTGSAMKERVPKFGGGTSNLSHSLSGCEANQKGSNQAGS
jgi:hypothetical protein